MLPPNVFGGRVGAAGARIIRRRAPHPFPPRAVDRTPPRPRKPLRRQIGLHDTERLENACRVTPFAARSDQVLRPVVGVAVFTPRDLHTLTVGAQTDAARRESVRNTSSLRVRDRDRNTPQASRRRVIRQRHVFDSVHCRQRELDRLEIEWVHHEYPGGTRSPPTWWCSCVASAKRSRCKRSTECRKPRRCRQAPSLRQPTTARM